MEITVVERNATLSFLSCGIAIGAQHHIPMEKMFYNSSDKLRDLGVNVLMEHSVESIDYLSKTATVVDLLHVD